MTVVSDYAGGFTAALIEACSFAAETRVAVRAVAARQGFLIEIAEDSKVVARLKCELVTVGCDSESFAVSIGIAEDCGVADLDEFVSFCAADRQSSFKLFGSQTGVEVKAAVDGEHIGLAVISEALLVESRLVSVFFIGDADARVGVRCNCGMIFLKVTCTECNAVSSKAVGEVERVFAARE